MLIGRSEPYPPGDGETGQNKAMKVIYTERWNKTFVSDLKTIYMQTNPFIIERTYHASIDTVWQAITDKNKMKQWYFDLAEFKPDVGFEFSFTGGPPDRSYLHLCKVTEVIAGKKITYSWRYDGYEGNSFVTFELFPEGNNTRLKLTHKGLETFPASNADFAKENFSAGWNGIIGTSLKEFLEKKG